MTTKEAYQEMKEKAELIEGALKCLNHAIKNQERSAVWYFGKVIEQATQRTIKLTDDIACGAIK